ncbi:hypothetical protein [Candidatus Odyssella acanthamoebae]|uniref:Uncharacterized protein n=1 Tax=Candidatus Odyssella acanthamoebae TaxID=91604 RepID=A0A077AW13_9PROT|nr:hypothetical protein [Candidatus Paracaedibacter acanthamoebae]AIK96239.1 hypothetical protein ID47_05000 [Candidatus Paracaedibacter acanthamoebae]
MTFEEHYKIAEFLREEFNKLKVAEKYKKIRLNSYKQNKHKDKVISLLSKLESFLSKVDSLGSKTTKELKNLQSEVSNYLEYF